jgi:lipopolysaccharide/colanic/teichoic acid biosynthesis glycosyltransferase
MDAGWQYRLGGVVGTVVLTLLAVSIADSFVVQQLFSLFPVIGRLPFETPTEPPFLSKTLIAAGVVTLMLAPLYKPQPRRILDIGLQTYRRLAVAILALATIGYFDLSFRLPRGTLLVMSAILAVVLPAWFVAIRRRPHPGGNRTIIIGDDPETMNDILESVEGNVIGYVSPPSAYFGEEAPRVTAPELADGGEPTELDELACLGGLSRLDEVLVEYDVGTAVLAFARPDRGEFFGALDSCYEHGVAARVHRENADVVLTSGSMEGDLVDINLEPWDWQDHVVKRLFDVAFAGTGLVVLSPVIVLIAVAIKLDSPGPVLYRQTRTAAFGDTFTVAKFRSMVTDAEAESGAKLSEEDEGGHDPRVTRVGHVLRQTHIDEIPQLLAILRGKMSVVGPRPERPELEGEMEQDADDWRRRWFVKPGLTGLAQINGVTAFEPEQKLRYDVAYIREQSFWYDLKIVIRQVWLVLSDASEKFRQ